MTKKKDDVEVRTFATPEEEIAYLKRQAAGLKGYVTSLTKRLDDVEMQCDALSASNKGLLHINAGLEARMKAYLSMPWYKRIFIKCC